MEGDNQVRLTAKTVLDIEFIMTHDTAGMGSETRDVGVRLPQQIDGIAVTEVRDGAGRDDGELRIALSVTLYQ